MAGKGGGIYFRFTVGRASTAGENARYITRRSATNASTEAIHLHNYPAHVREATTYEELRAGIIEYNREREDKELRAGHKGSGTTRTHYRARASFEGRVDTGKAREMAREYLEKHFPDARAVVCVHQDTDHTHIHVNMQARQTGGLKLHISQGTYKRLDKGWAAIYAREFGPEKVQEHELKKEEMRDARRQYAEARARGEDGRDVKWPERADYVPGSREHLERGWRNNGIEDGRSGGSERHVTFQTERSGSSAHGVREGERVIADAVQTIDRICGRMDSLLERTISREGYELER